MIRTTPNSAHLINTSVYQENLSSDQETEMQVLEQQLSPSQAQFVPDMYMPFIEGPKMDWRVNDGLYHRFLKWKLKCENILDCELTMLHQSKKCKKVLAWRGDFGMDQYVSWCLPPNELTWTQFGLIRRFLQAQANEVRARFDLPSNFCQGNRSVDEWYNAVQPQVWLAKYPQETANILHHDFFLFFLKDEEFVSKTINDSSIDLGKFPASSQAACKENRGIQGYSASHHASCK